MVNYAYTCAPPGAKSPSFNIPIRSRAQSATDSV